MKKHKKTERDKRPPPTALSLALSKRKRDVVVVGVLAVLLPPSLLLLLFGGAMTVGDCLIDRCLSSVIDCHWLMKKRHCLLVCV